MNAAKIAAYRRDYVLAARELFGFEADVFQAAFLRRLSEGEPQRVREALMSCAGSGKSAVIAIAVLCTMLLNSRRGKHPQAVCVSMSRDNLRAGVQKEIAIWMANCPWMMKHFKLTAQRLFHRKFPTTWFCDFRSFSRSATPEEAGATLSGLHSPMMNAYFLDEGGGQPPVMAQRVEQGFGDCEGRALVVVAGNPFDRNTLLGHVVDDPEYTVTEITADPDDPNRTERVDIDHARRCIERWGIDSAFVQCFILGRFPPDGLNTLLTREEVRAAMKRDPSPSEVHGFAKVLGVDVAGTGMDFNSICRRQGKVVFPFQVVQNVTEREGAAMVARTWEDWGADGCFIDGTGGYGSGWKTNLDRLNFKPVSVPFSGRQMLPSGAEHGFANMRSFMAWEAAQWVKDGGALPENRELEEALIATTYSFKGDKLILEPKDLIKARLGAHYAVGADVADSLYLTFARSVRPKNHALAGVLPADMPDHWQHSGAMKRLTRAGVGNKMRSGSGRRRGRG